MDRDTEIEWARANPQPRATATDDTLTLWNYPVGGTALAPAHRQAIGHFTAIELGLSAGASRCEFHVTGHASVSGNETGNDALAEQRAEGVAAYLKSLRARSVTVNWAGSTLPADPATTGLAHAHNRRVEVCKFLPEKTSTVPPLEADPPKGEPIKAKPTPGTSDGTLTFKIPIDSPPVPFRIGDVAVDLSLKGEAEITVQTGGDSAGLKLSMEGGALYPEVEGLVTEGVKGVVGLEPAHGGQAARLKLGLQMEQMDLKPEIGVQDAVKFVYFEFTLKEVQLPDITLRGAKVTVKFSGKIRLDVGPSEAAAARLAARLAPAAAPAAAVVGVVAAAAVINGGTACLAQSARAEGLRKMELLAARDGIAAGVAYEVLGTEALSMLKDQELQWVKLEGGTRAAFQSGLKRVQALLKQLGPNGRTQRRTRWTTAYGSGANALDFPVVQRRVFDALGGFVHLDRAAGQGLVDL